MGIWGDQPLAPLSVSIFVHSLPMMRTKGLEPSHLYDTRT
ncbi:hypothetical protein PLAN_70424 [Planktothrix rubescens CCAP 1459/22]|uniref:Uncharacterized protein n=1 Tax=Planktothrix rubescens CCAP 1459/22 TaxID=329571 RepID=A0A6J7ZSB0_PLARU|nr:hypothetical protein PLAN_70424 [Planktothrix rubescens NIVA-CYA 18]